MPQTARYYLSRVIKFGDLDDNKIVEAITASTNIARNAFHYTFIDAQTDGNPPSYVFGRLAKYEPQAEVDVVETRRHEQAHRNVPNLLVAASPFVYVPQYSAIAYQHIWDRLEKEQFEQYFADLVVEKYGGFFVECSVQPIADLRAFVVKLAKLDSVQKISAEVFPPNPLFGPVWRQLKDYLRDRNLREVAIKEKAQEGKTIETNIPQAAAALLKEESTAQEAVRLLDSPTGGITDAAVFMAADGYGKASIEGLQDGKRVTVRSRDTHRSFRLDRDPKPLDLYTAAQAELERLNLERGLEHQ
jgi:hypothetical protein